MVYRRFGRACFFEIDTRTEPDIAAAEAIIISQYTQRPKITAKLLR